MKSMSRKRGIYREGLQRGNFKIWSHFCHYIYLTLEYAQLCLMKNYINFIFVIIIIKLNLEIVYIKAKKLFFLEKWNWLNESILITFLLSQN